MLKIPVNNLIGSKKVIAGPASANSEDLKYLAGLGESGIFKPVLGKQFTLEQIIEAHRYVDQGHKLGNVIITLESEA
jgi:D-arabinose 1-dehydrogenase-like Zn-dependent alcohol dehydrogenase